MTRHFALIVGLGVYAAPVFAQGGDLAAAVAAIKEADKEWLVAATAKDLERAVSFWTDDAVIYPPGQPAVTGKDAIRRYVADAFKQAGFSISWQSAEPVVSKSGDMAYTLGPISSPSRIQAAIWLQSAAGVSSYGDVSVMDGGSARWTRGTLNRSLDHPRARIRSSGVSNREHP
jgi:ketosteroid isomerase-like protein